MGQLILTEIDLDEEIFTGKAEIIRVSGRTIPKYNGNADVVAIVGCRASANIVLNMDFPSLKIYQLTSAGYDGIPVEKFTERGVYLCNAGDVYSIPIAETVIYGMLQYAKRYWDNPKWHFFRPARGYKYISELAGKKLLIMGCGHIGNAVAKRAAAFDMDIFGYNHNCHAKDGYMEMYSTREELILKLGKFDYIVTTIPLTEETKGFLNAELLSAMKPSAIIVNVGRQGIFNDHDLYIALKNKAIGGAVLDMFEIMPNPITNKYRRLSNTIVVPGVSASSIQVGDRLKGHISNNINKLLNEGKPDFAVR